MKITILGSGTCVPSLQRRPCSVLLQTKGENILIDIGPGIIARITEAGVDINDIDMIFLSHFHLDHCADLAPFIFATKYPGFNRTRKLTLVGGKGIRDFFEKLNDAHSNHLELPETVFEIFELSSQGSRTVAPDLDVSWMTTVHKPESRAYRFQDAAGRGMVYTGDTDWCEELVPFSKGVELMICESAMPDELKVPGHLTPGLAGRIAGQAYVNVLLLTHLYPECEKTNIKAQCRKTFGGSVMVARDLMTFKIDEVFLKMFS